MDNLKVAPMSTISGITMLNTFGITDIGSLVQKTVQVGYDEVMEEISLHKSCF
jgi:hydroxymethylpyrimidine/phosphomethylpyrimidine kinase